MTAAERVQYAIQRSRQRGGEQVILRAETPAEHIAMHMALMCSHSNWRSTPDGLELCGAGWNVILVAPLRAELQLQEGC